jgi:hypothetical protein
MWLRQEDRDLVRFCHEMYAYPPASMIHGYQILNEGTQEIRAWVRGNKAIICVRGTDVNADAGIANILDDIQLSGVIGGDRSDLQIVKFGSILVESLLKREYSITVCGHSLGGFAAIELAKKFPQIERAVAFNGAAPITSIYTGAGFNRSRFYHVVGDLISCNMEKANCEVIRVKLPGFVNWNDVNKYHTLNNFKTHTYSPHEFWTAQQEQDDLVSFIHEYTDKYRIISLATGLVTKHLNRDRVREFFCQHPLPDTVPSPSCLKDYSLPGGVLLGTFLGGAAGALFGLSLAPIATVVAGAAITGSILGNRISSGEGLLDILDPIDTRLKVASVVGKAALGLAQGINRAQPYRLVGRSKLGMAFDPRFDARFRW